MATQALREAKQSKRKERQSKRKESKDNDTPSKSCNNTNKVGGGITAGIGVILLITAAILKWDLYSRAAEEEMLVDGTLDAVSGQYIHRV